MKKTETESTYDQLMKDPKRRRVFERQYKAFLLSELVLALMEGDRISVRKLAKAVGISPTIIQSIRSGKSSNITLKNFIKIMSALDAEVAVKKGGKYLPLRIAA